MNIPAIESIIMQLLKLGLCLDELKLCKEAPYPKVKVLGMSEPLNMLPSQKWWIEIRSKGVNRLPGLLDRIKEDIDIGRITIERN